MMAEIPSNILFADQFSNLFDGFSIGSNDLTQLTLGIDRDSSELASLFDERNPAVKILIRDLIQKRTPIKAKSASAERLLATIPILPPSLSRKILILSPSALIGLFRSYSRSNK